MVTGSFGDSTATTGFADSNLATFGCITVVAVDGFVDGSAMAVDGSVDGSAMGVACWLLLMGVDGCRWLWVDISPSMALYGCNCLYVFVVLITTHGARVTLRAISTITHGVIVRAINNIGATVIDNEGYIDSFAFQIVMVVDITHARGVLMCVWG